MRAHLRDGAQVHGIGLGHVQADSEAAMAAAVLPNRPTH